MRQLGLTPACDGGLSGRQGQLFDWRAAPVAPDPRPPMAGDGETRALVDGADPAALAAEAIVRRVGRPSGGSRRVARIVAEETRDMAPDVAEEVEMIVWQKLH